MTASHQLHMPAFVSLPVHLPVHNLVRLTGAQVCVDAIPSLIVAAFLGIRPCCDLVDVHAAFTIATTLADPSRFTPALHRLRYHNQRLWGQLRLSVATSCSCLCSFQQTDNISLRVPAIHSSAEQAWLLSSKLSHFGAARASASN